MIANKYLFNGSVEMQPEMNILNTIAFIRNHCTHEGGPNNSSKIPNHSKITLGWVLNHIITATQLIFAALR